MIAPLFELVKGHADDTKNHPIILSEEAREAIKIMKSKLTTAPILAFPDFYSEYPFIATTDASFVGISYMILQVQDGVERIICYGS